MPISWIALNSAKGLGPVRIGELLKHFGSPDKVFQTPPDLLRKKRLIPEECILALQKKELLEQAEKQFELAKQSGVSVLTLADPLYPVYLKEIFAPPPVIFAKGDLSVLTQNSFAVVGTRTPSGYGKQIASSITADLAKRGLVIVSGLAKGIDTLAHQAALDSGNKTIAVLGCGIDKTYPASNKELSKRICDSGVVITEFPMGTNPEAFNFPRRNRIISGLSAGVLVVEAGKKSGSLITAHYALNQGREVFAVPGPVTSYLSKGTFNLIKQGATPVCCVEDIMDNLSLISAGNLLNNFGKTHTDDTKQQLLNESEKIILDTLSFSPVRIDEITEKLGKAASELFDALLSLELKGFIQQISGQKYVRVV